jgi:hypothetical protein
MAVVVEATNRDPMDSTKIKIKTMAKAVKVGLDQTISQWNASFLTKVRISVKFWIAYIHSLLLILAVPSDNTNLKY